MNELKRYYYVAICKKGNFYFVTDVKEGNKVVWERGDNPYSFSNLQEATKVSDGLLKTGHMSIVTQSLVPIKFKNDEEIKEN